MLHHNKTLDITRISSRVKVKGSTLISGSKPRHKC